MIHDYLAKLSNKSTEITAFLIGLAVKEETFELYMEKLGDDLSCLIVAVDCEVQNLLKDGVKQKAQVENLTGEINDKIVIISRGKKANEELAKRVRDAECRIKDLEKRGDGSVTFDDLKKLHANQKVMLQSYQEQEEDWKKKNTKAAGSLIKMKKKIDDYEKANIKLYKQIKELEKK